MNGVLWWLLSGVVFSGLYLAVYFYERLRHLRAKGATRWQLVKGVVWVMRPQRDYFPAYTVAILLGPLGWIYLWVGRRFYP